MPRVFWKRLRRPWVLSEKQPRRPIPVESFSLCAVVGTWMEADVIEATVANAFTQGVEHVFLIDNGSPDDTVERATRAGAEHVLTYDSPHYDEAQRIQLMTHFAERWAQESDARHVWWLWLDADEFPRPQSGGTLLDMLSSLDRRFRIVGSRFLNHYPSPGEPAYVTGRHPIDHQPLCEEMKFRMCWEGHRKHPLIRWDREGPPIVPSLGFHQAICPIQPLSEPREPIVTHHFPFRDESHTRARLQALFRRGDRVRSRARESDVATTHMQARLASLDAVYSGDWARVQGLAIKGSNLGVSPLDWRKIRPAISESIPRWYRLLEDSS